MDFGSRFIESKGQPIEHMGKTLIMVDRYEVSKGEVLSITIETTNSKYEQAVGISEEVEVFGQKAKRPIILESFSIPPENRKDTRSKLPFTFQIKTIKAGIVTVYNMCIVNGTQEWWHNGSCMYSEEIEQGKRYFCNDVEPDEDFDHIIFTVRRVSQK